MTTLTSHQRRLVEVVTSLWRKNLRAPSMQEIADRIGVTRATISKQVRRLVAKGLLEEVPETSRTTRPAGFQMKVSKDGVHMMWLPPKKELNR